MPGKLLKNKNILPAEHSAGSLTLGISITEEGILI